MGAGMSLLSPLPPVTAGQAAGQEMGAGMSLRSPLTSDPAACMEVVAGGFFSPPLSPVLPLPAREEGGERVVVLVAAFPLLRPHPPSV
ncbi:hypothetical protein FKM82_004159 [Ascaphus truei]